MRRLRAYRVSRSRSPISTTAAAHWPRFAAALHERIASDEARYRSLHALPLRLRGQAIGGMNLFHSRPGPLPDADLRLGQALADIATIGILQERAIRHGEIVIEQLQTALNSRVIVEQAKGVLAQQGTLTMDTAFDRMRRYSRGHDLLLGEVARRVITERGFARQVLALPVR